MDAWFNVSGMSARTNAITAIADSAPKGLTLPPMIVNVATAADVPATLVARMLEETDAIWRGTGFTFVWRHAAREGVPYARTSEAGPYVPSTLRVLVGNEPGASSDGKLPLGWIRFDDEQTPEQEIYVSYRNAQETWNFPASIQVPRSIVPGSPSGTNAKNA